VLFRGLIARLLLSLSNFLGVVGGVVPADHPSIFFEGLKMEIIQFGLGFIMGALCALFLARR